MYPNFTEMHYIDVTKQWQHNVVLKFKKKFPSTPLKNQNCLHGIFLNTTDYLPGTFPEPKIVTWECFEVRPHKLRMGYVEHSTCLECSIRPWLSYLIYKGWILFKTLEQLSPSVKLWCLYLSDSTSDEVTLTFQFGS